jgi:hypothetical protein
MTGLSILNYILVYVARTPNHQNPDHEVKYQRQEDFHRIVSHPVCRRVQGSLSRFKQSVYTRTHLARVAFEELFGGRHANIDHKRGNHRRHRRDLLLPN